MKYSDAARRCHEAIDTALLNGGMGKWVAIRLSDGGSDGNIYDTKGDAVRHQIWEFQCAYIKIPPGGMPAREAEVFLEVNRKLYDAGMRLSDPDKTPILPYTKEAHNIFMRG